MRKDLAENIDSIIKRAWPTRMTTDEIASVCGLSRGQIVTRAKNLGLKGRIWSRVHGARKESGGTKPRHASDCATNNAPAFPRGLCDCGVWSLSDELRDHADGGLGALSDYTVTLLRAAADNIDRR